MNTPTRDTLEYLLMHLTDHPDDVIIEETAEEGKTMLTVHLNPEDMGKVIGKNGRIIRAVRDLVKLVAAKNNSYVDVILAE